MGWLEFGLSWSTGLHTFSFRLWAKTRIRCQLPFPVWCGLCYRNRYETHTRNRTGSRRPLDRRSAGAGGGACLWGNARGRYGESRSPGVASHCGATGPRRSAANRYIDYRRRRMSRFPATKSRRVLAALLRIGWRIKRQSGSHITLARDQWNDFVFAFHDDDEIGPAMLARLAKRTGLRPEDL